MNPNHMPYGQPLPMQQPQRRHDGSYGPMPPHIRSQQGYQPYYQQQMGPMMPQYPQHYAPNWYPYQQQQQQQHHMHPVQQSRPQYYGQAPMPPPQYPHHHGPLVVSSQGAHSHSQPSPRTLPGPPTGSHLPTGATPTTSTVPMHTPPSPPLSISTSLSVKKETPSHPGSPAPQRVQTPTSTTAVPAEERFFPPVPWLSVDGESFPPKAPKQKRQVLRSCLASAPVVYPLSQPDPEPQPQPQRAPDSTIPKAMQSQEEKGEEIQTAPTPTQTPTPLASDGPSDAFSTQPTTPSSVAPAPPSKSLQTPTQPKSRPALPIIPAVPILPQSPTLKKDHRDSVMSKTSDSAPGAEEARRTSTSSQTAQSDQTEGSTEAAPVAPPQPKSWANLFHPTPIQPDPNTLLVPSPVANGLGAKQNEALSEVLNDMNTIVETPNKIAFLTPRGLVNTGNMCYMNSVLQVLVFCIPFYDFLSKVARRAAHTFKSDTPLIDAIILFVQEYPIIDSATSVEQLRLRLKPDDYEKYGDSFIPEYVYAAIKPLPRFREMRRGHQQDAQEFLGFLLEELHEECAKAMRSGTASSSGRTTPLGSAPSVSEPTDNETGWMEVGHKQKPAVTRSSGAIVTESPVTNIFGGKLRSELKVSGNKLSVTLEPYSPLQLDIGAPEVHNIIDALRGLTRPESMQGEFQSARGQRTTATKQVFIETLPPVLILHLKRFHYDNTTKRAEKIWKKVGYPLDLELPKEVFPVSVRNKYAAHGGLPKYRLTGVIYHHGKNANGGHYTVDIRRQDGREWIRIDDTSIRRIRNEDVAEGGSEEDPKVLAAALERHKQGKQTGSRFEQIDQDDEDDATESDKVWSQVNGHSRSKSTMSAIANGAATPSKTSAPHTPREKISVKDNKVAYLLFYQRITA